MKRISQSILLLVTLSIVPTEARGYPTDDAQQLFYYSFSNKVPIETVSGRFMLKKQQNIEKEEFESLIKNRLGVVKIDWFNSDICTIFTDETPVDEAITIMKAEDATVSARPVYMISSDIDFFIEHNIQKEPLTLGLVDQIVLKYKDDVDEAEKNKIQKSFGLNEIVKNEVYELYSVSKTDDILSLSNTLFETGYFEFSYPELISKATLCDDNIVYPNDSYFQYQVTLHNTGQTFNGHTGTADADIDAPEAWVLTMGSEDIVIAVIDEGLTSDHPDLPNTRQVRLNGSNFGAGDPNDPSPTDNHNHGNACAGVIAATANNGEGIAGVAPLCKIMPIRFDDTTTPTQIANAILFAVTNGANIISNSWGFDTTNSNAYPIVLSSINYAISNGCLVLFSSGNTAGHTFGNNGYVFFPANNNINGMLTVGASDRYDYQADYSPTDTCIDIVAPSHKAYPYDPYNYSGIVGENLDMWSIDIPGNNGYNPWASDLEPYFTAGNTLPNLGTNFLSYTGHFGGTSHSCPVVAGVAALVLSLNPDLSPQTVCNVLTSTADKVGGYTYNDDDGRCNQMGYGRVNANNAVWAVCDTDTINNLSLINEQVQTITGCDIYIEHGEVLNNSILRIRPRNSVTIDNDTYIDLGSVLDIKRYEY